MRKRQLQCPLILAQSCRLPVPLCFRLDLSDLILLDRNACNGDLVIKVKEATNIAAGNTFGGVRPADLTACLTACLTLRNQIRLSS